MKQQAYGYAALAMFCLGMAPVAQAELKPISDEKMGEVTGQAFMQVENIPGPDHQFTRMTLGIDVETRVNIDDVKVGQTDTGVDFSATDVALGHISRDAAREQYDGNTYAVDDVVPFEAVQPYIELAEVNNELAGFRMGFQQARGSISSNTTSFSGNIGLQIEDANGAVSSATLFDAQNQATSYRATQVGIDDGSGTCTPGTNCAPLSQLRSLTVGTDNGDGTTGFTDDFFIGFQRENVDWQSPDGANVINAGKGVYLNLPTSMTVQMSTLTGAGLPRERTHYVDRGNGIF
ncbi:hypothetical protein KFJ24_09065 [Marinobacter sediminum]|uniref:hypothetical protein n=1 Tax=Marinobacter sediminum TaxID=256323 RepID=UPI00202E0BA7|nr:hypothetical protein [Marinobacter sediminum]MCM0612614.1 hypothetical protein [Marinobacter sediminum]